MPLRTKPHNWFAKPHKTVDNFGLFTGSKRQGLIPGIHKHMKHHLRLVYIFLSHTWLFLLCVHIWRFAQSSYNEIQETKFRQSKDNEGNRLMMPTHVHGRIQFHRVGLVRKRPFHTNNLHNRHCNLTPCLSRSCEACKPNWYFQGRGRYTFTMTKKHVSPGQTCLWVQY